MKIGIMGAQGSFSEEAARRYITQESLSNAELEYLVTAERVLTALEEGSVELGVFPIENSNGGMVIEAIHAMAKHHFKIKKLFELDVHQNLLGFPGTKIEDITAITSHDQALKQCRMYLKRTKAGAEVTEYIDTAQAAADLASGVLPKNTAVIASRAAAGVYGLTVLEESIQDLKFNYTTFIVAERID